MTTTARGAVRAICGAVLVGLCVVSGSSFGPVRGPISAARVPSVTIIDARSSTPSGTPRSRLTGSVLIEIPDVGHRVRAVVPTADPPVQLGRRTPGDAPKMPPRDAGSGSGTYTNADAIAAVLAAYPDARPATAEGECGAINGGGWSPGSTPPPPLRSRIAAGGWLGFTASSDGSIGLVEWYGCYA